MSKSRPTKPTPELTAGILGRLAQGESLRSICKDETNPTIGMFYRWIVDDAELAQHYARACEERAETYADEIAEIADDETIPADSRRIRIDARKWIACKLKPRKFGDLVKTEHSGPNGGDIPFSVIERRVVDPKANP